MSSFDIEDDDIIDDTDIPLNELLVIWKEDKETPECSNKSCSYGLK